MSAHEIAERAPKGRPQGGMKSDAGQAAYWRMQWESAIGALAVVAVEQVAAADQREQFVLDLVVGVTADLDG